ncbi:hypothetical protein E2C01_065242 [Portunus trituberculatus]|uniref:Uncharacterized protein n=1 Tax=Portunus trituberculatus TaxID=210409 RepID=A0A5B7HMW3_PORTR|nr:hypothetical protein [Portunus trituberculatus]
MIQAESAVRKRLTLSCRCLML